MMKPFDIDRLPMPFIVGAPRSGTTLLRFMLDAHPALAIPPETGFLGTIAGDADRLSREDLHRAITTYHPDFPGWEDFGLSSDDYRTRLEEIEPFSVAEGVREFYRMYAAKHGKRRVGDKTPTYCEHMPAIGGLLPEARFIHIIRDGRDVAVSLRKVWFAPAKDIPSLAAYWSSLVRGAREAATGRYMEVRYEVLISDPEHVIRGICDFIRLDYDPLMLRYWEHTPERLKEHRCRRSADGSFVVTHERRLEQQRLTMQPPRPDRAFAWRTELTAREAAEFRQTAGDMLSELGYE